MLKLIFMVLITDGSLVSDYCQKMIIENKHKACYPSKCTPFDHVAVGDIDGMRAHLENAESITDQFNKNER